MFGLNAVEFLLLLVVVLVLFGKRLPGAMHALGRSWTSFRSGLQDGAAVPELTESPGGTAR